MNNKNASAFRECLNRQEAYVQIDLNIASHFIARIKFVDCVTIKIYSGTIVICLFALDIDAHISKTKRIPMKAFRFQ